MPQYFPFCKEILGELITLTGPMHGYIKPSLSDILCSFCSSQQGFRCCPWGSYAEFLTKIAMGCGRRVEKEESHQDFQRKKPMTEEKRSSTPPHPAWSVLTCKGQSSHDRRQVLCRWHTKGPNCYAPGLLNFQYCVTLRPTVFLVHVLFLN